MFRANTAERIDGFVEGREGARHGINVQRVGLMGGYKLDSLGELCGHRQPALAQHAALALRAGCHHICRILHPL